MNKVSIKLQGGMCNYLFQIAAAYAYSKKHNKELFLIEEDSVKVHQHISSYKDNILNKITFSKKEPINWTVYKEPGFNYTEIPFIEGDVYLANYFQSEKYFLEYEKEIRELFSFPEDIVNRIKEKYKDLLLQNTCSIHVRRGDYLNFPNHHPVQNMNYYMKAVKKIGIDKTYLFFSDDIEYCKENFNMLPNCVFVEKNKDYEDLILMMNCDHQIMANSSFSWWGTFLNNNTDKIVIAPSNWFGKDLPNDTKDLYCEGWIKI